MSIVRPPKASAEAVSKEADAFIDGAPDSGKVQRNRKGTSRGVKVGNKEQIPVIMAPDLLDRLQEVADKLSMSRSAVITLAVNQFLKSEIAQ